MSRTDHHRPWRIRAEDRTVKDGLAYYHHSYWAHTRLGVCNDACGWTLPHWSLDQPPAWYRHAVWNGPERLRERCGLRQMAKEWNANSCLDEEDFPNFQHRHSAHWAWS
jgi:hypothetical protein